MASQASSSRPGASRAGSARAGEQARLDDSNQGASGAAEAPRLASFAEFWPYYVGEHANPWTRRLHFMGTTAAGLCLASAIVTRRPALVLGALVAGYGPAWASHFFVEKNRPATFTYPLWSLLADFKMWSMIARGTMDAEVERVLADREAAASTPPVASSAVNGGGANGRGASGNESVADAALAGRDPSGVLN